MAHNIDMSRGWESKSVESQMEEAAARRAAPRKAPLTPEQICLQRERESLELSRKRVLADLETVTHQRHREQLESALRYLDQETGHANLGGFDLIRRASGKKSIYALPLPIAGVLFEYLFVFLAKLPKSHPFRSWKP